MVGAVVGALVIGLLTIFAIIIGQGVVAGQTTTGWPTVLTSILDNITPIVGVVGIISMFLIVIKVAGGFGGGVA